MSISDLLAKRNSDLNKQLIHSRQRSKLFAWIRTTVFLIFVYATYLLLDSKNSSYFLLILLLLITFGFLVIYHQRAQQHAQLIQAKIKICEEEIDRVKGILKAERCGSKYQNPNHPYASDLDLFGPGSLFHHINRTETKEGEKALAETLIAPLEKVEALDRQDAIKTLLPQLEWRHLWLAALKTDSEKSNRSITEMAFPKEIPSWQLFITLILAFVTLSMMFAWLFFQLPFQVFQIILPVNILFLIIHHRALSDFGSRNTAFTKKFYTYIRVLKLVKTLSPGNSKTLNSFQNKLGPEATKAWQELTQLIYGLDSRSNILYWLINPIIFLDIILQHRLAYWHHRYGHQLSGWFQAVHEMEVLISLTGYVDLHSEYCFPRLSDQQNTYKASGLTHPLIPINEAISNDFNFGSEKISLVTGSNMSGKSTFLRTIGLIHVMAWIGLPVSAKSLTISRFDLFTSMRTTDDINSHTSSFYAELKRIQILLEQVFGSTQYPVLYFLDEILKGTNSHDRHYGASGLIKRLVETSSYGFISTHDLELAVEFENHPSVKNYSFNSSLVNDQLVFDYRISNSICKSANASKLMSIMGIITEDIK